MDTITAGLESKATYHEDAVTRLISAAADLDVEVAKSVMAAVRHRTLAHRYERLLPHTDDTAMTPWLQARAREQAQWAAQADDRAHRDQDKRDRKLAEAWEHRAVAMEARRLLKLARNAELVAAS